MKKNFLMVLLTGSLVGFWTFYDWLYHKPPNYQGVIELNELLDKVEVYTNEFGVPHVFAKNENDLFFVAGYIAARERLFQLAMVSLAVRGELASVLGRKYLNKDIYLRTWKIYDTGKKLVQEMDQKNRLIFEYFCKGINHRIDEVREDLPIEFKILGFTPGYWSPEVVAGYTRLMAHEMSSSWKPELVFGAIETYFGKEKLMELIPFEDLDKPTIAELNRVELNKSYGKILENEYKIREILGDANSDIGSNNWVLSGKKTKSGKPLLANDPHLAYSQPPRWYEIRLSGGRFDVSGMCLAGIPLPVIGQNNRAAWGFTNTMVDDMDFYIEKIKFDEKNKYFFNSEWRELQESNELFKIKNENDTIVTVFSTHRGPIISGVHSLIDEEKTVVSMSWTGHWITNEMDAWVGLTTMKNWDDFSLAVSKFGVPGQNIVYADLDGNIGWRPAVYVPIRNAGFSMVPSPGHLSLYDWKGKVPYDEMPFILNPESGYISTANNKTISSKTFPYYISGLWADPSRASRISKFINSKDSMSVIEMQELQLDLTSELAREVVPQILNELDKSGLEPGAQRAIQFLEDWNYVETKNSQAALVFHVMLKQLTLSLFQDEFELLGGKYLEAFTGLKYLTNRILRTILVNRTSTWIDDITTNKKVETLNEVINHAFINSVKEIENKFGNDWSNWKWGNAHFLTHNHILGKSRVLDLLFGLNIGPFPTGGSDGTPNAGGYSRIESYKQISGASMRRIVDFNNLDSSKVILPTGQSGLYNSPHYDDQSDLYNDGSYRTTLFSKEKIKKHKNIRLLELYPKK